MQKRLVLVFLFATAAILRFWNLGYSDYQGDEIKALYNPKEATSIEYFLSQRKGPMQFAVTAFLKNFSPDYRNRLLMRLPFALAGFASVVVFYLLSKALFGERVAVYSTIFFTTNGFFIAFSRIVQYQSLVIFFGLFAVYLIYSSIYPTKTNQENKNLLSKVNINKKRLTLGFVCWAISILSHYDGIFFAPIVAGILLKTFFDAKDTQAKKHLIISLISPILIFVVLNGLFYIPFVLNLSKGTTDYWAGRISGSISGKISSSRYLFSVYQPIYVLHIYTILGILGLVFAVAGFFVSLFKNYLKRFGHKTVTNLLHAHQNLSPILLGSVLVWFILPFIAFEVIVYIPGTHIYSYLIPAFLFLAFSIFHAEIIFNKVLVLLPVLVRQKIKYLFDFSILVLFAFLFLQSYYIYVDNTKEYPWENKRFLIWTLPKPNAIFHLSMFGFPYYRHWDEVADFVKKDNRSAFYTTNERVSISRYHIHLEKNSQKVGYYIHILNPQTFTNQITNHRIADWVQNNQPILEFQNYGRTVTKVYFVDFFDR